MYYEIRLKTRDEDMCVDYAYDEDEALELLEEQKQFHHADQLSIEVYNSDSMEELMLDQPVKVIPGLIRTH